MVEQKVLLDLSLSELRLLCKLNMTNSRDLYYFDVNLMGSQLASDRILETIALHFGVPRHALRVVRKFPPRIVVIACMKIGVGGISSRNGLRKFELLRREQVFRNRLHPSLSSASPVPRRKHDVFCGKIHFSDRKRVLIPQPCDPLESLNHCDVRSLLWLNSVLECHFHEVQNCIIITVRASLPSQCHQPQTRMRQGKGQPDISTRRFLRTLVTALDIPVYGLCEAS